MNDWVSIVAVFSVPVALIGLYVIVGMVLPVRYEDERRWWFRATFLVLLGVSSLVFHVNIDAMGEGVLISQRGATIAIAALFGGMSIGVVTAVAEIVYRIFLGGVAVWGDVMGIGLDLLGSIMVWRYLRQTPGGLQIGIRSLVLFGAVVGAIEALTLLLNAPVDIGWGAFVCRGGILFIVQFMSVVMLGGLLHLEESRMQALLLVGKRSEALRRSLHQVVGALSAAMMHRDPGTAGHEQRVSDLAVAVGKELGWDDERLEGLHLAAMVHDVGQIQIPAEILNRPRALKPQEFELVKMHVESGHQILKDVEFPWPIAEIVYQHHENLDGSGYPRGLKGDQILAEARVIRICDAIEAMLTHRPFRRAYTLEQALSELQQESGSKLDARMVDICVRLFSERGFAFSGPKIGR